jgi:hypothetical protein
VDEEMLMAIDGGVLRNYDRILELKDGNFYGDSLGQVLGSCEKCVYFSVFHISLFSNGNTITSN